MLNDEQKKTLAEVIETLEDEFKEQGLVKCPTCGVGLVKDEINYEL